MSLVVADSENGPQSNVPSKNYLVVTLLRMLGDLLRRSFAPPAPYTAFTHPPQTDNSKLAGGSTDPESMDTGDTNSRRTDEQV